MPPSRSSTLYVVWPRLWPHPIAALRAVVPRSSRSRTRSSRSSARSRTIPARTTSSSTSPRRCRSLHPRSACSRSGRARARSSAPRSARSCSAWFVIPLAVVALAGAPRRRALRDAVRARARDDGGRRLRLARRARRRPPRVHRDRARASRSISASRSLRIHPYYLDYFGEQVGGPARSRAHRWFETAWWGEGVDRAVDYVNAHAAPNARVFRNCIEPAHLAWFREDLWTPMTNNPGRSRLDRRRTRRRRASCPIPADARRVFTRRRAGRDARRSLAALARQGRHERVERRLLRAAAACRCSPTDARR